MDLSSDEQPSDGSDGAQPVRRGTHLTPHAASVLSALFALPLLALRAVPGWPYPRGEGGLREAAVVGLAAGASGCEHAAELPAASVDVRRVGHVLPALRRATRLRAGGGAELRAWRRAQTEMLQRTLPIRSWPCVPREGGAGCAQSFGTGAWPTFDDVFWAHFSERFRDPTWYLGLVYIPIPWHLVVENYVYKNSTSVPRGMAVQLLESLDHSEFQYFTVMTQACAYQLPDNKINWTNVLIFDSRGADCFQTVPHRIPIPLLRTSAVSHATREERDRDVFFAGSCHFSMSRSRLGPGKDLPPEHAHAAARYNWIIRRCSNHTDDLLPFEEYLQHLYNSTWAVAASGCYPPSFGLYEIVQSGALPIIIASSIGDDKAYKQSRGAPTWCSPPMVSEDLSDPFVWLPYRDLGIRWNDFGVVTAMSELQELKAFIESMSDEEVKRRYALLRKYQPLFTPSGLIVYIEFMLSEALRSPSLADLTARTKAYGRAVDASNLHCEGHGREGRPVDSFQSKGRDRVA